jgi:transglutaminase superfamily protein
MNGKMPRYRFALLCLHVAWELLRYEIVLAVAGFSGIYKGLTGKVCQPAEDGRESAICQAVDLVCSCYWKRVLCLQRSVVTARILRLHGIGADVVIGYGLAPFISHAWVEVDGRIVNDLTGYPEKLQMLDRSGSGTASSPLVQT